MEEWKIYPRNPDYEVSVEGEVRRARDKKILKQYQQRSGYVYVWFSSKHGNYSVPVHRIVAETFLPFDYKIHDRVDHINTIRSDNRVDNLQWTDARGNANNPTTKINMSNAHKKKL